MDFTKNLAYRIKDDLREHPVDTKLFSLALDRLEKQYLELTNIDLKIRALSKIGVYHRINSSLEKSFKFLYEAKELMIKKKSFNSRNWKINQIRIAQSLQFSQRHAEALVIYNQLISEIQQGTSHKNLLDFVYQHQGKVFFELKKFNLAKECFLKALEIRKKKNISSLIESTQKALQILNQQQF